MLGKNILFFIGTSGRAQKYGVGTYIKHLINGLSGIDNMNIVQVHLDSDAKKVLWEKESSSLRHVHIPIKDPEFDENNGYCLPSLLAKAIYCIVSEIIVDPASCIFHINSVLQYELAAVAKKNGSEVVYTQHISLWRAFYKNKWSLFFKDWEHAEEANNMYTDSLKLEKSICEFADKIICLTEDAKKFNVKYYGIPKDKMTVIRNGVELNSDEPDYESTKSQLIRRRYGYGEHDKIVLYVGRLQRDKGVDGLIGAFKRLLQTRNDVKLLIVGGGDVEHYTHLCHDIRENVNLLGFVEKATLKEIYLMADIGILPSLNEQSSFVSLEMMQHSVPMVLTDIPGFEVLKDGFHALKAGTIKKEGKVQVDEGHLASCINQVLCDSKLASELASNSFDLLREELNSAIMCEKTLRIYKMLLYSARPL